MSIRKSKVEGLPLTKELTARFRNMVPVPGERDWKQKRDEKLFNLILCDEFFGVDWHVVLDLSTGIEYRADGQHSSKLLDRLDSKDFPQGRIATVTTWEVDSIAEDGPALFRYFNASFSSRNAADVIGVGTAQYEDLGAIPKPFQLSTAKGIRAWIAMQHQAQIKQWKRLCEKDSTLKPLNKPAKPRQPDLQHFSVYFNDPEHRAFAVWLYELSRVIQRKDYCFIVTKPGIVSVIRADWTRDSDFAGHFWRSVVTASAPKPGDVSRECLESLLELKNKGGKQMLEKYQTRASKFSKKAAGLRNPPPPPQSPGADERPSQVM